ncbi:MAG: preprotein translocase subunit SecE [Deltaproteobacteria bacterium]|nr:preprotein translocase subunit SecE [Deltaproteobacteria bacterium]
MRVISSKRSLSKSGFSNNKIAIKLNKGLQFFREVSLELKKVTWPTRKQTIGLTVVVIILVLIISLFLGIIDIGLSSLIRLVLH